MNAKGTWITRKQKRVLYITLAVLALVLLMMKFPINPDTIDAEFKNRNDLDVTMLTGGGHIPGRKVDTADANGDDTAINIKKYTQDIATKLAIEKATKEAIILDQNKNKPKKKVNDSVLLDSLSEYSPKGDYTKMIESSPVVIFSKSYCPYSKKLKALLSSKYKITPEPFILELDLYEHGSELQKHIGKVTKRKTVPNLIVNGFSYGGCDDIVALDNEGKLLSSLTNWLGEKGTVTMINDA